jgi:hypothetical protein
MGDRLWRLLERGEARTVEQTWGSVADFAEHEWWLSPHQARVVEEFLEHDPKDLLKERPWVDLLPCPMIPVLVGFLDLRNALAYPTANGAYALVKSGPGVTCDATVRGVVVLIDPGCGRDRVLFFRNVDAFISAAEEIRLTGRLRRCRP